MKSKIFLSINIPEKFQSRLKKTTEKWQDLPVRWTRGNNLHLTLAFLGYVDEKVILEICQKTKEAAEKNNIFDIEFKNIELFPSNDEPRMVALLGEANEPLRDLVNEIESVLGLSSAPKKTFRPHITLGRVRKNKWEALENKPPISEKFSLMLEARSVDIMASDFEKGEMEYSLIESCPLG